MVARKPLQSTLADIEDAIVKQSERIEVMVVSAYQGLQDRCLGTAESIFSMEEEINREEVAIEEKCLSVLALQQPVASDLRRTAAALKINVDLERIADLALNLAERTEAVIAYPRIVIPKQLSQMVLFALEMVRDARKSFLTSDTELAQEVCRRDSELDEMNRSVIAELIQEMESDPINVAGYLHVFSASRIVERIGDHATNIAEDVEYVVDGEIHRHREVALPE